MTRKLRQGLVLSRNARTEENERSDISPTTTDDRTLNYHSFPDSVDETGAIKDGYRGFSTSINDMFVEPENEGIDCCSLACCGILQNDRNRYLVTGVTPPSCCKRFWVHIIFPCWLFAMAMACAVKIEDPWLNEAFSAGFVFTLIGYFVVQCFKGMWKRRDVRADLLWSRHHMLIRDTTAFLHRAEDDASSLSDGEQKAYLMGQTLSDIRNAHSLCGCYAADRPAGFEMDQNKRNFCNRIFQCFERSCCGAICGMNLQICGMCGTAQEARELQSLLQPGYRRVDYITMQPMIKYYAAIYEFRHCEGELTFTWWDRLSGLSRWILCVCSGFCLILLAWSLVSPILHKGSFSLSNYLVFCATLFQAYALLKIVHWNHTKDISTDALIKFFASGFCLSTTLAVFFELAVGLTMKLAMIFLMAISGIDLVKQNAYQTLSTQTTFGNGWMAMKEVDDDEPNFRDYLRVYAKDHPFVYAVYLFLNAFVVAAVIEELCKYFGYRMVEHPDFLSRRDLEEATECHDSGENQAEADGDARSYDFSLQDRTHESRGAAITISMVAVGLGFSCCENLVYIFVYGESSVSAEALVLLARSLFPVHPIAAALQSIGVCSRDLEKRGNISIGKIVFPGILFHGLYDFCLMFIDFMDSKRKNFVDDDDDELNPTASGDLASLILSLLMIFVALYLYFRASRRQRERLRALDQDIAVDQSRLL